MRGFFKKSSSFTLIETLIVVLIIGFLIVGITASLSQRRSTKDLDFAAQQVQSALNQARSLSLSPHRNGVYGYGVYFNKDSDDLIIFHELVGNSPNHIYSAEDVSLGRDFTNAPYIIGSSRVNYKDSGISLDFDPATSNTSPTDRDLSVFFSLPLNNPSFFPYAKHTFYDNKEWNDPSINDAKARIILNNEQGEQRIVEINLYTDLITIKNA